MRDLIALLFLRPKVGKFLVILFLGFVVGSCLLALLAWIARTLGI